jgi:hypothetical protein
MRGGSCAPAFYDLRTCGLRFEHRFVSAQRSRFEHYDWFMRLLDHRSRGAKALGGGSGRNEGVIVAWRSYRSSQ